MPSPAAARAHLEATLLCARAGAFRGTFGGTDAGPFGVLVDAKSGLIGGFAYSRADRELLSLTGSTAVSFDGAATFVTGQASSGATFAGAFSSPDRLGGTWTIPPDSGTFSGARVGGGADAQFRFTGIFAGGASGLFAFDVGPQGSVTGVAYTITSTVEPGTEVNEIVGLSGTVAGTTLSATTSDGDGTIAGTLSTASGTMSGTWSDRGGGSGTFTGTGCQLN